MSEIEINDRFKQALDLMEAPGRHVFITGRAGTGKSTLLQYFREHTSRRIIVLAPTGVAAVNVGGQTIHSFFQFKPDITPEKVRRLPAERRELVRELDAIVIDEVSMVRADLMDCIDRSLRKNGRDKKIPFGGIKLILIGDLYQLPPVVLPHEKDLFRGRYASPYFFSAEAMIPGLEHSGTQLTLVELEKIYRQKDASFIAVLNAIRSNEVSQEQLAILNSRLGADFRGEDAGFTVTLVPANAQALEINHRYLSGLGGRTVSLRAEIEGAFKTSSFPADEEVMLRQGAQVMLLNNDSQGRWVNGTMGVVTAIERSGLEPLVIVRLENGEEVEVSPNIWDMFDYTWDAEARKIDAEVAGTFRQYPLKLAWAVTIHKSQGKTFDRVIIDMGRGAFAYGQTYVALSRARTLEGIALKTPIRQAHVFTDWRVVDFMLSFRQPEASLRLPREEKVRIIEEAVARGTSLEIEYLSNNGEVSRRRVWPQRVGDQNYKDTSFCGMLARCELRQAVRMFRVERILALWSE